MSQKKSNHRDLWTIALQKRWVKFTHQVPTSLPTTSGQEKYFYVLQTKRKLSKYTHTYPMDNSKKAKLSFSSHVQFITLSSYSITKITAREFGLSSELSIHLPHSEFSSSVYYRNSFTTPKSIIPRRYKNAANSSNYLEGCYCKHQAFSPHRSTSSSCRGGLPRCQKTGLSLT